MNKNPVKFRSGSRELSCLSSFSGHSFSNAQGIVFPTAEHAFHWAKFYRTNAASAAFVLAAASPAEARRRGRKAAGMEPSWNKGAPMEQRRVKIMRGIIRLKAAQNPDVRAALLNTGDRLLVEDSPWDNFWGRGRNGQGRNVLGKLWMELRAELRRSGR